MIYTDLQNIPRRQYQCIEIDPAWHHKTYSDKGITRRSPSFHYKTMPLKEIKALPIGEFAAPDCHLFMWTTQPHLEQSFAVLKAWGFKFSSVFKFWIKLKPGCGTQEFMTSRDFTFGTGYTTRKNVEIILLGRRGSPARLHKGMTDLIFAEAREHSRKPDLAFSEIEKYCAGPRLELFGREERLGWDVFGDEAQKFAPPRRLKFTAEQEPALIPADEPDVEIPAFLRRTAIGT